MAKTIASPAAAVTTITNFSLLLAILLVGARSIPIAQGAPVVGVNYGTVANNLPPPATVAQFLIQSTTINRIKLFDVNPTIMQALANTGIAVTVTVANDHIPPLTNLAVAQNWLRTNILPYTSTTNVIYILVGNEVVSTADDNLIITGIVPAMQNLHKALIDASLDHLIKVSTPHSLGILSTSFPPSNGKFKRKYITIVFKPLLSFLRATGSPFMINPYPFFGLTSNTLDYALFLPNSGVYDQNTGLTYNNMLDGQLDAIFSAMKRLGFADVDIVIAETGWPSAGDPGQMGADVETAASYNRNLIRHVSSGRGTPLMPNRTFETYIFALFNENLKPGPTIERNFGLFQPDMTPVYDIGIQRHTHKRPMRNNPAPVAGPSNPKPINERRRWCVPKLGAQQDELQANIDYVCGQGINCGPIQAGGPCFLPNTVQAHAAYAMNAYYQMAGHDPISCDFKQTGMITTVDPSMVSLSEKLRREKIT